MTDAELERIANWVIARGLDGASEPELLHGFCSEEALLHEPAP